MPDRSVAAVVTDPPWNMGRDYGPDVDDARPHRQYVEWLGEVVTLCVRVARGSVALLAGSSNLAALVALATEQGWWHSILWWEPTAYELPFEPPHPVLSIEREPVVWLRRSPPGRPIDIAPLTTPLRPDPHLRVHPCPKPVGLAEGIIRRCVDEPGAVLDPFVGTGSMLAAAVGAGRQAIGVDANRRYVEVARERLAGLWATESGLL